MVKMNIETLVTPYLAKKEKINLVVGVIDREYKSVLGFGKLGDSFSNAPNGDTIFEIGSITKAFTATLLSILVENKIVELTTHVNKLKKEYEDISEKITLEKLATHTSGLPRLPTNFMKLEQMDLENPYEFYKPEDLDTYMQNYDREPERTFGKISYSNVGFGLLGYILSLQLNQSYEEAIIKNICNPLGLLDTRITMTNEQKTRLAIGHSPRGKPVKNWNFSVLEGTGALRASANDLLEFLSANLQISSSPLNQALTRTHELKCEVFASPVGLQKLLRVGHFLNLVAQFRGEPLVKLKHKGVALGWLVSLLPSISKYVYWQNGGTGGYRSFCGFVKDTKTGVVILSNYSEGIFDTCRKYSVDTIGFKILENINLMSGNR